MSMPVSALEVAMTPATSPSPISMMRAPASRTLAIRSAWRGRSRMQTTRSAISAFLARARFFKFSAGAASRSTTPSGSPPPTAILSIYTSGALRKPPSSAIAKTASALAPPLAVIVVPSSGSSAMSILGPCPVPTVSPIYSIGASSRSPSPITTVPSIDRLFSACRIASTAAWSAAFSSPRPISREADSAAASVTRTASSARLRSILELSATVPSLAARYKCSEVFDTDHARRFEDRVESRNPFDRALHRRLDGDMRRQNHRHRFAGRAAALDHRLHRDMLVPERRRDIGDDAGLVDDHQPNVIGALMALHRRSGQRVERGGRHPERWDIPPGSNVHQIGGDRRGGREGAGAAAFEHDATDKVALGDDGIEHALDRGDRGFARHHAGMDALL